MKKVDELSIFFPAYNEQENIGKTIDEATKMAKKFAEKYEILIVLLESTDNTLGIIKKKMTKNKNLKYVIQKKENKGMGYALRQGLNEARYNNIFYSDSDLQFDLNEFEKFLPYIKDYDIIIGFRIKRKDPWTRIFIAKIYNLLVRTIFDVGARDVDCAFRFIKKKVVKNVTLNRRYGVGSTEILVKARKGGFKTVEVGVNHYERKFGGLIFESQFFGIHIIKPGLVLNMLKEVWLLWKEIHIDKLD